jgi:hypothetical protein
MGDVLESETASDDLLAEQIGYYRRRAEEYDATSYRDLGFANSIKRMPHARNEPGMGCTSGGTT